MVFFNWATMQMAAKIVYYGPGLCGKTTNLSYIYAKTAPSSRGEMVSLETESDRTLFFDLLPIEVGTIGGFKTRLQLYTVPGQVFYNTTRKLVLKGVDGIVFVADSQRPMREANRESLANLRENLRELGIDLDGLPLVLQYNKRDLKNILTIEELQADLNPTGELPYFEASAINGVGVFETLKEITKITLKKLRSRLAAPQVQPAPPPIARAAAAAGPGTAGPAPAVAAPAAAVAAPAAAAPQAQEAHGGEAPAEPLAEAGTTAAAENVPAMVPPPEEPGPEEPELLEEEVPPEAEAAGAAAEAGEAEADTEEEVTVSFDEDEEAPAPPTPPPMKRVRVSNQMDILAELENLRQAATMETAKSSSFERPGMDLDSLLASELERSREIRRKLTRPVNARIFKRMRTLELEIAVRDEEGRVIGTLEPLTIDVKDVSSLDQLLLLLNLTLENTS